MGNSYWNYMYGGFMDNQRFVPKTGHEPLHGKEKDKFIEEWTRLRYVLTNSGYDLDKIKIVRGLK